MVALLVVALLVVALLVVAAGGGSARVRDLLLVTLVLVVW